MEVQAAPEIKKRAWVKTFGCQMNVHDSERMQVLLSDCGYTFTEGYEDADLVILNGCEVREKAVQKLRSLLGEINIEKKKRGTGGKSLAVGVGGCVGVKEAEFLISRNPELNFVFGTDTIDELPEILYRLGEGENHIVVNKLDRSSTYSTETKLMSSKP